ncbi:MAG: hypothetical protein ABI315_15165, partial [Bacteroidia bacterium]
DSTIDSIKKSLPLYNNQDRFNSDRNIEMLKQITRINFLELKKDLSDKLIALQIINNVVQNETIMDKELYNQATDFCYLFSP